MGKGARVWIAMVLVGAASVGCSTLAGIEDLELTGSPDASPDTDATVDSGGSGSDARAETGDGGVCSSGQTQCAGQAVEICVDGQWGSPVACASGSCAGGACAGTCASGQVECSGNGVQSCGGNGQWGTPVNCVGQTCANGACTGTCAPGQTNPVPCGNCGTDTQTCSASGAWQTSGSCAGEGTCAPDATQTCNSYGTQTCTAACTWGTCSCASAPACTPGTAQCSGTEIATCGGCGQLGTPSACASGTCVGGVCSGSCTQGQKQCSGNGVQTCGGTGQWGTPAACTNQTCVSGACTGTCAPGQTDPVACGHCGTDTQTCSASGTWQTSGSCAGQGVCAPNATQPCNTYGTETCSSSCAWGSCSCTATPVCTPNAKQCSGSGVQTCSACGQWGNPVSCGSGMTCSGGGSCVVAPTDCPGGFLLCDGFESGSISSLWQATSNDGNQTITVDGKNPHHGSYSLHVHINALNNGVFVESHVKETSIKSSLLYIRAFYSLSALPGPDNDVLLTLWSDANSESASGAVGFLETGFFASGVSNTVGDTYDYSATSETKIPTGTSPAVWTCIEAEVDTSYTSPNPNGLLQVWHDSTTVDSNLIGTAELQPLIGLSFGLDFGAPSGGTATTPVDLYVDDIAIDTKYIGCSQ